MNTKQDTQSAPTQYSLRLKKRDVRRWNWAQIIMARRLGILEDIEKFFKMSELFARITDIYDRPARFTEVCYVYANTGKATIPTSPEQGNFKKNITSSKIDRALITKVFTPFEKVNW